MNEDIERITVDMDEFLNQLIMEVRKEKGDGEQVIARLRELAEIAEKIDAILDAPVEIPAELVDRWNQLVAELYPDREKD